MTPFQIFFFWGGGIAQLVEWRTCDQRITGLILSRRISSPELTFCAYSVLSVPPQVTFWHIKTLVIPPKLQVTGYIWKQVIHPRPNQVGVGWLLSRHSVGTAYGGNELAHSSSGNTRPHSSQLAEPLWTDPGLKKERHWCAWAVSTFKKIKNTGRWGMIHQTFPQNHHEGKATITSNDWDVCWSKVSRMCVCVCVCVHARVCRSVSVLRTTESHNLHDVGLCRGCSRMPI